MPSRTTLLIVISSLLFAGCSGVRPMNLGVRDGKLAACPATPNCVSSQAADRDHSVDPLRFTGKDGDAIGRLKAIVNAMPRARIITETPDYIHAEFTSAFFRFVDDVEFLVDGAGGTVHVRSASRVGSSDLGVNRKRVEAIRQAWNAAALPR
jgi:uncharacterized protein (DUF1499 family)